MTQTKDSSLSSKPLIILTAGGTGGHVFPAESLAEELSKRGFELALVTDSRGKNNYHGKLNEIPNYSVLSGPLVGKSKLNKIKSLLKTCLGIVQAGIILLRKKPICVVGFGGYASFPCCMAAILLGVDLVIHEQNSVMSRTNRFLSKYATLIAQSFRNAKYTPLHVKSILTGMPIRASISALNGNPYPKLQGEKFNLLVIGGSQGAKIFGEIIPEAVKLLPEEIRHNLKITQQCKEEDITAVKEIYAQSGCELDISSFFNDMPKLYTQSHLIISRAGASSVFEIVAAGLPSILIPLPTAADDHQTANARYITDFNGGIAITQKDFTPEKLSKILEDLISHPERLQQMSLSIRRSAITDASERLADAIEKEIITKR